MENVKQTTRLLALVFGGVILTAPATRSQDAATPAPPAAPIAETRYASCLLKIVMDPSVLSLGGEALHFLFQSSGVRDRAAKEALDLTPEQAAGFRLLTVTVLEQREVAEPHNERQILLLLEVSLPNSVKPAAKEFMTGAISEFRGALAEACRREVGRLDEQINLTALEVTRAEEELVRTQKSLLDISQEDLSSQTIRSRITAITSELESLRLENASQKDYRNAIELRIAELQEQMSKSLSEDAIATELQQIVRRRMVELERVREVVKTGVAVSAELDAVEDKLATARIDLARRRDELSKTGVASGLEKLTGELGTVTLDAVQARAKEQQLEWQLKEARSLLSRAAEYERIMLRLDVAKQNMQEAMIQHNKAQQRGRMLQMPSVSVIGD